MSVQSQPEMGRDLSTRVHFVDHQNLMLILGDYSGLNQLVGIAEDLHSARHPQRHQYQQGIPLALRSKTVLYILTKVPQSPQANQPVQRLLTL